MASVHFKELAGELKSVVEELGVKKEELQAIADSGGSDQKVKATIDATMKLLEAIKKRTAETTITPVEQKRKTEELQSRIELLRIIDATSPSFEERMRAEREISRLTSLIGVYQSATALRLRPAPRG